MNVGQVLETHLGLPQRAGRADWCDGKKNTSDTCDELRFFERYYDMDGQKEDLDSLSDPEILLLCENLKNGVPMATPFLMVLMRSKFVQCLNWRVSQCMVR